MPPLFLQPLIDTNSAYFKCFVAEEKSSGALIGYVLFFHTLDADRAMASMGHGHSAAEADPVAVVEDLYVAPEYRGRKIATQLFRQVLKVRKTVSFGSFCSVSKLTTG